MAALTNYNFNDKDLKCSYGTSKYCRNFLKDAYCESMDRFIRKESNKACPFIHYFERRRDLVIENDREFNNFLQFQFTITNNYFKQIDPYFKDLEPVVGRKGNESMPTPETILGRDMAHQWRSVTPIEGF